MVLLDGKAGVLYDFGGGLAAEGGRNFNAREGDAIGGQWLGLAGPLFLGSQKNGCLAVRYAYD